MIGGFLAAVFWVFSIVDCIVQPASRHRGVPKAVWIAIVVVLPVIGGLLWFAIGRIRRGRTEAQERYPGPREPSTPISAANRAASHQNSRKIGKKNHRIPSGTRNASRRSTE